MARPSPGRTTSARERAVEEGRIQPLKDILAKAHDRYPGQVIEAELEEENDVAATLLLNHLAEQTRPLTPALGEAMLADLSDDERARVLLRVSLALRSEPVLRRLYPSPDDLKKR